MLLKARWVVPVEPAGVVLERHAVLVRDGQVAGIFPWADAPAGEAQVDLGEHVLIPGLVNAHTQAASVLRRGRGNEPAFPAGAHEAYEGARLACAEMLRAGITCFGDAFDFPEASIDAAAAAGMRCSQGLRVREQASAYASDASDYLSKGLIVRDRHRDTPRVSFHLAPHAVSEATLRQVAMLAAELDLPVHADPDIDRLERAGLLEPGVAVLGAAGLGAAEIARLGRHGCSVIHCPSADLKHGHPLAAMPAIIAAGVNIALGTLGAASNHRLDLFHEMSVSRLAPHAALKAATLGGARALGIDDRVGSILPGKAADLVAVALRGPELAPCEDPVALLVYSAGRQHVTHVWVDGREAVGL